MKKNKTRDDELALKSEGVGSKKRLERCVLAGIFIGSLLFLLLRSSWETLHQRVLKKIFGWH